MSSSDKTKANGEQGPQAVVRGFAKFLPARQVTNEDLCGMMETSDEWITQRTGIKTRCWVTPPESTSSLAAAAAQETLRRAGVGQVDAIIAATLSPDYSFPGLGVQVHSIVQPISLMISSDSTINTIQAA